jgi:serine/threonine-protein kinase
VYPQIFGKYVLERELSRGGMARVLLATLRGAGGFEKKLVVKQIRDELAFDQQFVRRFVEEAKTTVALSHPNIVPVYELGVEQGTYFLAMELVEGVSIAELLRPQNADGSRRVLSPDEGAYVGIELCRALDYAHRRMKVVHRDITPRNVMIDEEGQIKLIDFGIAAPALVAGQEILGSPGHMAPEQVDGGELGPATDIFAVAVLLMEAWTGTAPFRRPTPEECAAAVREKHPRPSDFEPRLLPLDDAIARAMQVDPRARQQEASELARSLRSFIQELDVADIARALGDRVRDLRVAASVPDPTSDGRAPRVVTPSAADLGTKTFAAREEALGWSRPPSPPPAEDAIAPSTRKIAEPPQRDDPAMAIATPLMVDQDDLDKIHADIRAARQAKTNAAASAAKGRSSTVALVLVGIVAAFGVASWSRARGPAKAETEPRPSASVAPSAAPPPPPVLVVSAPVPSSAPVVDKHVPSPPVSVAVIAPAAKASVVFVGEPGTTVAIDGVVRGPCPVRTTLPEGVHDVRFTFEPTGESRGERFSVKPGESVTVRAEFTRATPTVTIQR